MPTMWAHRSRCQPQRGSASRTQGSLGYLENGGLVPDLWVQSLGYSWEECEGINSQRDAAKVEGCACVCAKARWDMGWKEKS